MADRKLSALASLTAPTADDELYIIDSGVPKRIRMDDMSIDGTFTPTLYGSTTAGTQTYSAQQGYYSRIGNIVHFQLYILLSAYDVATAGELRIGGLPFTSISIACANITYDSSLTMPASSFLRGLVASTGAFINLYAKAVGSSTFAPALNASALMNSSEIVVSGTYRTS